jgi:transcriptional regulator with XRE-family HTH domain
MWIKMGRKVTFNEFSFRRQAAGITQRQMAKRAGVDYARIKVFEQTKGQASGKTPTSKLVYDKVRLAYQRLPDWREKVKEPIDVKDQVERFLLAHAYRIAGGETLVVIAENELVRLCRILAQRGTE